MCASWLWITIHGLPNGILLYRFMVKIIHVFFLISEPYTSRKTDCMSTFAYQHPAPHMGNFILSYRIIAISYSLGVFSPHLRFTFELPYEIPISLVILDAPPFRKDIIYGLHLSFLAIAFCSRHWD